MAMINPCACMLLFCLYLLLAFCSPTATATDGCDLGTSTVDDIEYSMEVGFVSNDPDLQCSGEEQNAIHAVLHGAVEAMAPTSDDIEGGKVTIQTCTPPLDGDRRLITTNANRNQNQSPSTLRGGRLLQADPNQYANFGWFFYVLGSGRCRACWFDDLDSNRRNRKLIEQQDSEANCGCNEIDLTAETKTAFDFVSPVTLNTITATSTGPGAYIEVTTAAGERTAFGLADGVDFGIGATEVESVQVTNGKLDKISFCGQTCKRSQDAFEDKIPEIEQTMMALLDNVLESTSVACLDGKQVYSTVKLVETDGNKGGDGTICSFD